MIPQEAIEAARAAIRKESMKIHGWGESENAVARAALEAAAPFLRAQALEEAADEFHSRLPDGTGNGRAYNSYRVAELLKARAVTERGL